MESKTPPDKTRTIELRLARVAQLYDPLDPLPPPTKDLSKSVEEFIVSWARELPHKAPLAITIHAPASDLSPDDTATIQEAASRYFKYRADRVESDLRELFRVGRTSLFIGLGILAACALLLQLVVRFWSEGVLEQFFADGIIIFAWVANWKPIEVFLYDWWPILRRLRIYRRLAAAPIRINAY